jgi:hypothetical protein
MTCNKEVLICFTDLKKRRFGYIMGFTTETESRTSPADLKKESTRIFKMTG